MIARLKLSAVEQSCSGNAVSGSAGSGILSSRTCFQSLNKQPWSTLGIVQVDPFGPTDEISDGSIKGKLDSKAAQILRDFSLVFVAQIIALQLVDLVELGLHVPFAGRLKKRLFLEDASHFSDVSDVFGGFL